MKFKRYKRTAIAEMRDIELNETRASLVEEGVSISKSDLELNDNVFKKGKIARNPKNHKDLWYVAYDYFIDNFEEAQQKDPADDNPHDNPQISFCPKCHIETWGVDWSNYTCAVCGYHGCGATFVFDKLYIDDNKSLNRTGKATG